MKNKDKKKLLETHMGATNPLVSQVTSFSRISAFGDKNSATTTDGLKVQRLESIFFDEFGLVYCVPYELHFVYYDPSKIKNRWALMCTCGSPAVILSYNSPVQTLMSRPTDGNKLLACMSHTTTKGNTGIGSHADNSTE